MREQRGCEGPRGKHFPFFPSTEMLAEMWRNGRRLVHPARSIRKTGIAVHRWQSRLAREYLHAVRHRQAVANVRRIQASSLHRVLRLEPESAVAISGNTVQAALVDISRLTVKCEQILGEHPELQKQFGAIAA
jgi:hypothetical protein